LAHATVSQFPAQRTVFRKDRLGFTEMGGGAAIALEEEGSAGKTGTMLKKYRV